MFTTKLEDAVKNVPGGEAAILMGFDGILVDMFQGNQDVDVETMGMEFSVVLKDVRKATELLEAGAAQEMTVRTDRLLSVLRIVNDEYFLIMSLSPKGNIGKARYVLRMLASDIYKDIE